MCTGIEAISLLGAVGSAAGGIKALTSKPTPQVVTQSPAIDSTSADTAAAQAAAATKLNQRRAARANSLLSAAGAAGDPSDPLNAAGVATGKTAFGQ